MANTVIQLKKSSIPSAIPDSLANGEIALNFADGKLYYKSSLGTIRSLESDSFGIVNANGTLILSDSTGDTFSLVPGDFITITGDAINDRITIGAAVQEIYNVANAAFEQANTGGADLSVVNNYVNVSTTAANNYAGAMANAANAYASSLTPDLAPAFNIANAAFDKANAANVLAYNTGIGANNYAGAMANAANAYAASLTPDLSPVFVVANNAYDKANAALPNTTGAVFEGNLNIKTDLWIGNNITNVSSLIFNTSTNRTPSVSGELTWSQDESTLRFDMGTTANVTAHIGQDLFYLVKNQSGSTINKGTVVRFAGTLGSSGRLLIAPAIANNSYPSKYVMGVAATNIVDGDDGYVLAQGKLRGINTSSFSDGDILYVSPTTAGAFSNTIPTAPNNKITIAAVVHKHASSGVLEVRLTLGSKLDEDELVETGTLIDGDIIQYVSANGRFENKQTLVSAYNTLNAAFTVANAVFAAQNADYTMSNAGYNLANTVYAAVNSAFSVINAAYTQSNTDNVRLSSAYVSLNAGYTIANAGFTVANAAFAKANATASDLANTAVAANNYAGAMANSGNAITYAVVSANLDIARAYTNTSTSAANNYAGAMANSANARADTKLANTSGVYFNGNLFFPSGNVGIGLTSTTDRLSVAGDVISFGANYNSGTKALKFQRLENKAAIWSVPVGSFGRADIRFTTGDATVATPKTESDATVRIAPAGGVAIGNAYLAQNPTDGNLLVSGNIGVNTINPQTKLHANGSISSYSSDGTNYGVLSSDRISIGQNNAFRTVIAHSGNESLHFIPYGSLTLALSSVDFTPSVQIPSGKTFGWSSTTAQSNNPDLVFHRDAANTFAQRNGTAGQTYRLYGTYTDGSNNERLRISANTTAHYIIGEENGTGLARPLYLGTNNSTSLTIDASGNVGIGTISPAYKLDVIGSANISNPTLLVAGQNVLASFAAANNYAGVMANAANAITYTVVSANLDTARAYTNTSTTAANNYAGAMANSGNVFTSTVYAAVNSAFAVINAAYTSSNADFTLTNAVFTQSNTDNVRLSAAYVSANANYVVTNAAFGVANSALAAANQAGVVANNANTYSNSTYVKKVGDTITGDLVVQGNLTTSGVVTYANTQTLLIGDNIITLNADLPAAVAPSEDSGIEIRRGTQSNVALLWNEGSDRWTFTNDGTNYRLIASNTDVESANNYAGAMANSGNVFSGLVYTAVNSAFGVINAAYTSSNADYVVSNAAFGVANGAFGFANGVATNVTAAFAKANAALSNTSGVSFAGSLYFPTGTGNVGIGTTSTSGYTLYVNSTANGIMASAVAATGGTATPLDIYGNASATALVRLRFGTAANYFANNSYIETQTLSATTSDMRFGTAGTERMRIVSDGNVAIGQATAPERLTVFRDTDNSAEIGRAHVGFVGFADYAGFSHVDQNGTTGYALVQGSTGDTYLNTATGNPLRFRQGNVDRMTLDASGNFGIGTASPAYKLHVNGSFAANTKSFVIDHPTKPGMKLRYGSLEGPENGVYVRGKIEGNVIELPDYWTGLVHEDTITVQLTAIGRSQNPYVVDISDNKIYIDTENHTTPHCFYHVYGERKDVEKLVVEF